MFQIIFIFKEVKKIISEILKKAYWTKLER